MQDTQDKRMKAWAKVPSRDSMRAYDYLGKHHSELTLLKKIGERQKNSHLPTIGFPAGKWGLCDNPLSCAKGGWMVTDKQVKRLWKLMASQKTMASAEAMTGRDVRTARNCRDLGKLPSEVRAEHTWRTREDSCAEVWEGARAKLRSPLAWKPTCSLRPCSGEWRPGAHLEAPADV